MASKNYKLMVKKLKKQLNASRRKEKSGRNKLRAALAKAKKMGRSFQRKLDSNKKDSQKKVAAAQSAVYLKIADAIKKRAKKSSKTRKKIKSTAKASRRPKKKGGRKKSRR